MKTLDRLLKQFDDKYLVVGKDYLLNSAFEGIGRMMAREIKRSLMEAYKQGYKDGVCLTKK